MCNTATPSVSYVSSQYLDGQGQRVRWLPSPAIGAPDLDGRVVSHKFAVLGQENEDLQAHFLSLVDLEITSSEGIVENVNCRPLAHFEHNGSFQDLQVVDFGADAWTIAAASSEGSVTVVSISVPRTPGIQPEDLQVLNLDLEDGALLKPWANLKAGPIVSVDVRTDSKRLLAASRSGSYFVLPLDLQHPPSATAPFRQGSACSSCCNARWVDSQTFLSCGAAGLQMYDTRQASGPVMTAAVPADTSGAGALCGPYLVTLSVHPSRPNLAALGTATGSVLTWDLRQAGGPQDCPPRSTTGPTPGSVTEIAFDASEPFTAAHTHPGSVPLLFSTSAGLLAQVSVPQPAPVGGRAGSSLGSAGGRPGPSAATPSMDVLMNSPYSVNSFDVEKTLGQDIVCVTDQHDLVYMQRALP